MGRDEKRKHRGGEGTSKKKGKGRGRCTCPARKLEPTPPAAGQSGDSPGTTPGLEKAQQTVQPKFRDNQGMVPKEPHFPLQPEEPISARCPAAPGTACNHNPASSGSPRGASSAKPGPVLANTALWILRLL